MPRIFQPNPLRLSDSYKDTHFYPALVSELLSYMEARGGEYPYTEFFGLQGILMEHFEGQFFTQDDLEEEYENSQVHFYAGFPYPKDTWQYILDKYEGLLPVEIRAVKEGIILPVGNALYTIQSTDEKAPGIGQWMETILQHTWYPTGVATKSRMCKELYREYLYATADPDAWGVLEFMLQDFGFRGATGTQAAARGGAAHIINMRGSDTKIAMDYLSAKRGFYGAPRVTAYSVPASEHSTMTIMGETGEADMVGGWLKKYPKGILSLVGDSYDIFNFCREILGRQYRDVIRTRDGKVVVRPDSGDPVTQVPQLYDILASSFGSLENSKLYRYLPPCLGLLWGDGMDYYSIQNLLRALKNNRWSVQNLVNGMGGGLLQKVNRDTQKTAIKLCNAVIDDVETPVRKNPVTDRAKASKGGRLALLKQDAGRWVTMENQAKEVPFDQLELIFRNGEMKRIQTYDEICTIAETTAQEWRSSHSEVYA